MRQGGPGIGPKRQLIVVWAIGKFSLIISILTNVFILYLGSYDDIRDGKGMEGSDEQIGLR